MERTEPIPSAAVIGAGPSGLAAAHTLVRRGWHVDVYERSEHVGGMARALVLWGETLDAGPHVLVGGDPDALDLWNRIAGPTRSLPLRRALLRRSRLIPYPPSAIGLLHGLSPRELLPVLASALRARLRRQPAQVRDTRTWFTQRYGGRLYNAVLKNYIGKLWGTDGEAIDASFIHTVSTANFSRGKPKVVRHIDYPVHGLGAAWEQLVYEIEARGRVCLGSSVQSLIIHDGCVIGIDCGVPRRYDAVLSAAPLAMTLRMLPGVPASASTAAAQLRSRNIVLAHLRVHSPAAIPFAWVFVDDPALTLGRVTDSRFWKGTPTARSGILTLEFWCGNEDAVWREDDQAILRRAEAELHAARVLTDVAVEAGSVLRIPNALPVPVVGYRDKLQTINTFVSSFAGLYTIGRHGSFELDSTLSAMAHGIATARRADVERRAVRNAASSSEAPDQPRQSVAL